MPFIEDFFKDIKGGVSMENITCTCCKKSKKQTEYYYSGSHFHKGTGKLHVCKPCIWDQVGENVNDFDLIKSTLRMIDRPFLSELWKASEEEVKKSNNNLFKTYMKNLAMRQYKDLNWDDGDKVVEASEVYVALETDEDIENVTEDDFKKLTHFFGKGLSKEDYIWLQAEFQDFVNRYECDSKGMELLIKQICLTQLDIEKRRAANEKVDAQLKTLQDLLGSSNLKPVQETGANAVEQESFGTLIKKFENEKPIPEPDPKWADVDKIGKYIRVFFLGHLTRMLGIKNEYEDEYWDEINQLTVEEPLNEIDEDVENGIS